jgi:mRNA interferase MazF
MPRTQPDDVWWVDLGLAAKVRPCLVLSDYPADDELALLVVIPHTTALRGNRWELAIPKSFLKPGVFHFQQIQSVPIVRLERRMGKLTEAELSSVRARIVELLRLTPANPITKE